jgi:hypothetical protein
MHEYNYNYFYCNHSVELAQLIIVSFFNRDDSELFDECIFIFFRLSLQYNIENEMIRNATRHKTPNDPKDIPTIRGILNMVGSSVVPSAVGRSEVLTVGVTVAIVPVGVLPVVLLPVVVLSVVVLFVVVLYEI